MQALLGCVLDVFQVGMASIGILPLVGAGTLLCLVFPVLFSHGLCCGDLRLCRLIVISGVLVTATVAIVFVD